tara:strand:- start:5 stop:340 length:336 start_codon:yes stop_codon:yes gene_type:complete
MYYKHDGYWINATGRFLFVGMNEYVLNRTLGLQFLMAKSQDYFGRNIFSEYLHTTAASILMICITYKLHEELFNKNYKNFFINSLTRRGSRKYKSFKKVVINMVIWAQQKK